MKILTILSLTSCIRSIIIPKEHHNYCSSNGVLYYEVPTHNFFCLPWGKSAHFVLSENAN